MDKKVFADGLCFWKYFLFFVFGCIFGTYFEELLTLFLHGSFSHRDGLLIGPFSPLYGFGVVAFLLSFGKMKNKGYFFTILMCALLGGFLEFLVHLIIEIVYGIKFWDYSSMFLNIGGRTTIPFMIVWGIFGMVLLKFIYPLLSKWIEKIPYKIGFFLCSLLFIFLLFDILLTSVSFVRFMERKKGVEPKTFIGEFCDIHYSDNFMKNKFPLLADK